MSHSFDALLIDAAGTLLHLREPVGQTYARLGRPYGVQRTPAAIQDAFVAAMKAMDVPMAGDGRVFWRRIVAAATGVDDPAYFEAVYAAFGASAWTLTPGALAGFDALRAAGVKVGMVSNWDTRLRAILEDLGVLARMDVAIISGEIGVEKPDPAIFRRACAQLGVAPARAVHVGDSRRKDVAGAQAAGCQAWKWPEEVGTFAEIQARILR